MKPAGSNAPSRELVARTLGRAQGAWDAIHEAATARYGPLTPEAGAVRVAVVLGERAAKRALASGLPGSIKTLIAEARPYAEGRGIRFPVRAAADAAVVAELIALKMET